MSLPSQARAVVIGGGIIGCSTAYHLAKNGWTDTVLLERYFGRVDADILSRYRAMTCASLLRETMWSMAAEIHSRLDFDAPAYTARQLARFEEALRRLEKTA